MMAVHLVPSGSKKTFCGLDVKDVCNSSSLGMLCTCESCKKVAEELLHKNE